MANTVFSNKIIEAKAKDLLSTAVNARSLMTIDNSLAQEAGMTKTINVYTYSGEAEEVGVGEGNTNRGLRAGPAVILTPQRGCSQGQPRYILPLAFPEKTLYNGSNENNRRLAT